VEEILEGAGKLQMLYNYMTSDRQLFRINETIDYEKIIKVQMPLNEKCGCSGRVDTFYIVNGIRIPTNRATKIC